MKTSNNTSKINWIESDGETMSVRVIDLSKTVRNSIYKENKEYLKWVDGTQITHSDLAAYFLLFKYENGVYSLTHKDDDFYIHDIIFSE